MKTHAGRRAAKIKKQSVAVNNDERRWFEKCGLGALARLEFNEPQDHFAVALTGAAHGRETVDDGRLDPDQPVPLRVQLRLKSNRTRGGGGDGDADHWRID